MPTDRTVCRSGKVGWTQRLQDRYPGPAAFTARDEICRLAESLGYPDGDTAWQDNPQIRGSTDPSDYQRLCHGWWVPDAAGRLPLAWPDMQALRHHTGWVDGRSGFLWCRFDAVIDEVRLLRAEVTWDDNGEREHLTTTEACLFHEPELLLERNALGPDGNWVRRAFILLPLTQTEAAQLIAADPRVLLLTYVEQLAVLQRATP